MKKLCLLLTLALVSLGVRAQSFGEGTYKAVGVYDTWELSPFRTGQLTGNVAVVKNHLYSESGVNRTGHIAGIQRSRFGSNTFGLRVYLNESVEIGRSGKYVHALVWSPRATKVMFVGLGRRTSNTWGQTGDAEQFWSEPVSIQANTWTDAVAQVKTNENVVIESIVVVPDCQSPHALTEDFVAYVDEVVVNTSSRKRTSVTSADDPYENSEPVDPDPDPDPDPDEDDEIYALNFEKSRPNTRTNERFLTGVSLTSTSGAKQEWTSGSDYTPLTTNLYLNGTATKVFDVTAGETYTPHIDYSTDWMHAYCYVDFDRDGVFTVKLQGDGHTLDEGSELVTYSALSTNYTGGTTGTWYNSDGTYLGDMSQGDHDCNTTLMPAFTIPENLQSGLYRMRLKIDWNCTDPAGNDGSDGTSNQIWSNAGGIVDVLLRVTGRNEVSVAASSYRNGTMATASGEAITSTPLTTTQGVPYEVRMLPANGFMTESLTAAYKKNSTDHPGYLETDTLLLTVADAAYNADADAFTLPADVMYAGVLVEPMFNMAPVTVTGDLNGDGHVTIADVTALVNIILSAEGVEHDNDTADLNGDGRVTITDVTLLVNIILSAP